ncbi:pentapeptide repeat-containing protein [Alkalihalobacillus oceani]|uniref:Pentapeptide repeat-containing protein n=1 Tax=Halalkalibacter oceani TaxID=1653776 RepID=A0A9X2DMQ5_9BACI|nr:pentapeptide repeat-containing protein [Halalkalibacter oceani]MCM3713474.1 pentapeptide repeat-containing protein [Halalkalibacter oceani]
MQNELQSNCSDCFGLCCVALPYMKSNDFPYNKDGGQPCQHLETNHLCSIHDSLRDNGFNGCVSYECFGAGQKVSQLLYKRRDWREHTSIKKEMFAVFPIVQQFHEMLVYLQQSLEVEEAQDLKEEIRHFYDMTEELTLKAPDEIISLDLSLHRSKVNPLFLKVSELYRSNYQKLTRLPEKYKRPDYIGVNLKGLDFRGESFRGKWLMAANFSHSDLRRVDFIGADMRDTDFSNANLAEALYLTQAQVNSAKGNLATVLPHYLNRPEHWQR